MASYINILLDSPKQRHLIEANIDDIDDIDINDKNKQSQIRKNPTDRHLQLPKNTQIEEKTYTDLDDILEQQMEDSLIMKRQQSLELKLLESNREHNIIKLYIFVVVMLFIPYTHPCTLRIRSSYTAPRSNCNDVSIQMGPYKITRIYPSNRSRSAMAKNELIHVSVSPFIQHSSFKQVGHYPLHKSNTTQQTPNERWNRC